MQKIQYSIISIMVLAFTLVASHAMAVVTAVTTSPGTVSVSPTGGGVTITWRVVNVIGGGGTVPISSANYEIRIDGVLVQTVAKTLSRTVTVAPAVPDTTTFTETLPISAALASQMANGNNNSTITRIFTDGAGGGTGVARVIVGGATGQLSLNRIDLSFENGTKTKVVGQREELFAVADISYRAKGLLVAEWQVVDANTVRGGQFQRVIGTVRMPLSAAGNGRVRLKSPRLPTTLSGLHQVRLFIRDPDLRFEEPILRYYVSPSAITGAGRLKSLNVVQPAENVALSSEQPFVWLAVPGAAAYQIEIFRSGAAQNPGENISQSPLIVGPLDVEKKLVAGKIVPGNQTSATLQSVSFKHLEHGRIYLWRIRAINGNGHVIAQSDLREISYP